MGESYLFKFGPITRFNNCSVQIRDFTMEIAKLLLLFQHVILNTPGNEDVSNAIAVEVSKVNV